MVSVDEDHKGTRDAAESREMKRPQSRKFRHRSRDGPFFMVEMGEVIWNTETF